MTGAFVVTFNRRPAGEGLNGGTNGGMNMVMEFIEKHPGKRVVGEMPLSLLMLLSFIGLPIF